MAETIYVRGEGGSVFAMDLPLPEAIAARLAAGQLRQVNADGSQYREPAASPPDEDPGGAGDPPPPPGTGGPAADTGQAGAAGADPPPPADRPEPPARNAATGAWRTWATQHGGLTAEQAGQLSRDELIEMFAPEPAE